MGELGTIGEAAKGIGEGIEHAANGTERLLARIQDMASGPLATRRTKKLALAAKEAARGAVDVAKTAGAELSDHDRRAIAFDAMRSIQGFTNIEETVRMARLPGDADLGAIDDEWLSAFVNGAKEAFSDWKREVFAHTVESKVFDPSGVSIRALHAISRMEREDIRRFEAVCGLRPEIDGERGDPMIVSLDPDALKLVGLDPDGIMALCDIGVLRRSSERKRRAAIPMDPRFPGSDSPAYQRCVRPEKSSRYHAMLVFPSGTIEIPCLGIHIRRSIKSEFHEYVDYGDFSLTDAGKSLAEIVRPCDDLDVAGYISRGYEILGRRESEMLSDGAFCEREFDRAVMKSINRQMRRR